MQFSEEKSTQPFVFHRTDARGVLLNDQWLSHSFLITAEPRLMDWDVTCLSDLTRERLIPLMAGNPDLILLGVGKRSTPLPHVLLALCFEKRIGLEAMTTPAAIRTYNVLVNEGRRVAVGLIL